MQLSEFNVFLHSKEFEKMLNKVGNDDVKSFRNNNEWLIHHPSEALMFKNFEAIWSILKPTYLGEFKTLVYGDLPDPEEILKTLEIIGKRLKQISWTIEIDEL